MEPFSNQEYADMHLVYGFCSGNSAESRREYSRRYPNRRLPNARTFVSVHQCLAENGRFPTNGRSVGNVFQDIGVEEAVLDCVERDPRTSTRAIAREVGVSQTFVSKLLRKEGLYPYHFTSVHTLEPRDPPQRLQFCRWIQQNDHSDFLKRILWTDESSFTRDGVFTYHNEHYYEIENPHLSRESRSQTRFKVNVWIGMIGNNLVGPYLDLPMSLNGVQYLQFLRDDLPELLEDLPLDLREQIIFQADGAPPHFNPGVQEYINNNFAMWIGRGGTAAWPPRSPSYANRLLRLGVPESRSISHPVHSAEKMRQWIVRAANHLRDEVNLKACVRKPRK